MNLGPDLTVQKIENLVADARSDKPARTSEHNGKASEGEEWVEGHLADQRVGDTRGQETGTHNKTTNTSNSGEEDLDTAAAQTQLEEGVPVECGNLIGGGGVRGQAGVGTGEWRSRENRAVLLGEADGTSSGGEHGGSPRATTAREGAREAHADGLKRGGHGGRDSPERSERSIENPRIEDKSEKRSD